VICVLNDLPTTNDVSHGFFRRIVIIPFRTTIQPKDMDPNLSEKLLPELPGALNWCYEGYKRLRENNYKLSYSKVIAEEIEAYKERENHTGRFFLDTYEPTDQPIPGTRKKPNIRRSEVYNDYELWCRDRGEVAMNRTKFYQAIQLKASEKDSGFKWKESRDNGYQVIRGYKRKTTL
jgi:putative DNA primase/helicase